MYICLYLYIYLEDRGLDFLESLCTVHGMDFKLTSTDKILVVANCCWGWGLGGWLYLLYCKTLIQNINHKKRVSVTHVLYLPDGVEPAVHEPLNVCTVCHSIASSQPTVGNSAAWWQDDRSSVTFTPWIYWLHENITTQTSSALIFYDTEKN